MHWFEENHVFKEENESKLVYCHGKERWTTFSLFGGEVRMSWRFLFGILMGWSLK